MESQVTRTNGKSRKLWWLAAIGALVALRFYYVQEMVAALMIFSALFVLGGAIVLVVFVLDLLTKTTFTWVESGAEWLGSLGRKWQRGDIQADRTIPSASAVEHSPLDPAIEA